MPPRSTPTQTFVVFRPRDLPLALTWSLPPDAALRDRLCYVTRTGTDVTARLFEALPEPPIEHVAEGMKLAREVGRIAAHSRRLAELLRPEDTHHGPVYFGVYAIGLHSGDADEVEAWLRAAGHRLVPMREVLDTLLILMVAVRDAAPPPRIALLRVKDGQLVHESYSFAEPGVFALERMIPIEGPVTIRGDGCHLHLASLPATGLFQATLVRRDRPSVIATSHTTDVTSPGFDLEWLARGQVGALLDPRGIAHDPRRSRAIWFMLPAAIAYDQWNCEVGRRALAEEPNRGAIASVVVEQWTEYLLEDDAFTTDDLRRYEDSMFAVREVIGTNALREAKQAALARLLERGLRYGSLARARPRRWVAARDPKVHCVACARRVSARHYVFRCDQGHEAVAHRACARRHVARTLSERVPSELACAVGRGCHVVGCARSEVPGDPHAARLLRTMITTESLQNAVIRVIAAQESSGLVEWNVAWTARVTYHRATDEPRARARTRELVDAIDAPREFRASVLAAVLRRLRLTTPDP